MANLGSMADKKIHTLGIRVDDETYKILEALASEDDRTVSWLVRKMVDEWLKNKGYRQGGQEAGRTPSKKRA